MCMNMYYGSSLIGGLIGKVVDVEVEEDNMGWGTFLKVKIEIPLDKTIARG